MSLFGDVRGFFGVSMSTLSPGEGLGRWSAHRGDVSRGMSRVGLGGSLPLAQYLVDLPPDFVKVSGVVGALWRCLPGNTLGKAIERIAVNFFRVGEKIYSRLAEKMRAELARSFPAVSPGEGLIRLRHVIFHA